MSDFTYSYDTMSLTANGNLDVPDDIHYAIASLFTSSMRGTPYLELAIQTTSTSDLTIYNSVLKKLSNGIFVPTTSNADELILSQSSSQYYLLGSVNDKRVYTCDNYLIYENKAQYDALTPSSLYFNFKNSKGTIEVNSDRSQELPPEGSSSNPPYTIQFVNENSIYYYYANTIVYLLIDYTNTQNTSYGFTIYIMQSYSSNVSTAVNFDELPLLYPLLVDETIVGAGNTLPSNWAYSYYIVPNNESIQAVAVGTIYKTRDGLLNAYIYLSPTYCNKLYESIMKTQPQNVTTTNTATTNTSTTNTSTPNIATTNTSTPNIATTRTFKWV